MNRPSKPKQKIKAFLLTPLSCLTSLGAGFLGFYAFCGQSGIRILPLLLFIILLLATIGLVVFTCLKTSADINGLEKLKKRGEWLQSILDAIPFPVHVTDNDMKWTFLNRAFEKLLQKNGIVTDRHAAVGLACSKAGATICNTDKCGIRQLKNGVNESYFDWHGMKCKQDTAAIADKDGNKIGFVEVVTDLTSIIELNEYNTAEISRLDDNLKKLAAGDLDLDFTVGEGTKNTVEMYGKFKIISENLSKVKKSIARMINDAEALCETAINGELDKRADLSRHEGEYRQVIEGINKTMDAVVTPVHFASDCILKIASGETIDSIDNTYKGDYAKLIDSISKVYASLKTLVLESTKLAEAGAEGDLSVRGSVDKINGNYAQIINGFNNTLDSILNPVNEAIDVLAKMAVNNLSTRMQTHNKGSLGKLAESINLVCDRILSIQNVMIKTSKGNLILLEEFKKIGRRSENDNLIPAAIAMMQSIQDLTQDVDALAEKAAIGDLTSRGNADKYEGGYKKLIVSLNKLLDAIENPLNVSSAVLEEWKNGNLNAKAKGNFSGIYEEIQNAFNDTSDRLCETLKIINVTAGQVAAGSEQIASGSQNLSQGATEQAGSLEELTASVAEIAQKTKDNAENASSAKTLSDNVHDEAIGGNEQMKQMLASMKDISESSGNIAKIIKVIEDIAFQTNILALNAAVEAARAGQAGKGFAVVAEEVRNLAARSAKAANETTELIENTIKKVETGTGIADKTAGALDKIVNSVGKFAELIGGISDASNLQASGISQIDSALGQVSKVVQTNSATAEESAAASEELSSQAQALKELVGKFEIGANEDTSIQARKSFESAEDKFKPSVKADIKAPKKATIFLNDNEKNKYGDF